MGDYEWGRENGLWGEDGIPYEIADQLSDDDNDPDDFKVRSNNLNSEPPHYSKEVFPGMRESGNVKNTSNYTIAEYEDKGFRLESIALEIQHHINSHFVLYDYKGSILTNSSEVIRVLHTFYTYDVYVDGDVLGISDTLLALTSQSHTPDFNAPLENDVASNIQLWHMQLHPNYVNWGKEKELLEKYALIGLGKSKQEPSFINFEKMKINDIVLVRRGNIPVALVQVNSELEEINDNKDETLNLDWFKYRRKVIVLEYANSDMDKFPNTRGTLSLANNKNSLSYQYIIDWYNSIPRQRNNPIKIPKTILIKEAPPSFNVESISKSLSAIITKKPDESGMMVGIFGKWGRGKTYLFNKIWESISSNDNSYHRVDFSAWKYQETKESWAYLYENLINAYLTPNHKCLPKWLSSSIKLFSLNYSKHKYLPIFSFLLIISFSIYWNFYNGSTELIKLIVNSFSVIFIVKLFLFYLTNKNRALNIVKQYIHKPGYSDYLGMQAEIENEIEHLLKTWIPKENDGKVILFVDDIDRCETSKIVKLIDGLRIILDNPEIHKRLIIITAIDEKILKNSIEDKYQKLNNNDRNLFKEYIEKIFIIGIKLNDLEIDEVKEYISNLVKNDRKELNAPDNRMSESQDALIVEPIYSSETVITVDDNGESKSSENSELKTNKLDIEREIEISKEEETALIESISRLNNPTPRKIRIFYYKYLILKQIFHVRLLDKKLIDTWDIECDEKIIIDILIHISNSESLPSYSNPNISIDILEELKYSANMLSVL
ncbi:KAP family NTPase [Enterovibrio sp. ZSDZ35]|uniref:KAP family NTPase n=1 Tax=Enterovibrio qingdaonensis TaxID=2899818 RepID=A0ABT5QR02_9GAMM|nr:P-loop NTPase fold protein [Enterovibrio sp. ZSDZ35]MDD1783414.1 KAP family NTPase [Enterovibrio sp. ZSDZ35]